MKSLIRFISCTLFLICGLNAEQLLWQISDTPEFDFIHPDLQETISAEEEIAFSSEVQDYLSSGIAHYFRYKIESEDTPEEWSLPIALENPNYHNPKVLGYGTNVEPAIQPYLLPENHPLKSKLDAIFSQGRVITSIDTFGAAGFDYLKLRKWDNVIVAWHSKLKGYLVKAYMDDQIGIHDQLAFMWRIEGAEAIRHAIQAFGYQKYFKVPKKWLYPLPDQHPTRPGLQRKKFILVEQDMDLVSASKNSKKWEKDITKPQLKALYTLLQTLGLIDSVYITNIPFSKDGKIAFIDTEHHHKWPVPVMRLERFLSPEMKVYWLNLFLTNGTAD